MTDPATAQVSPAAQGNAAPQASNTPASGDDEGNAQPASDGGDGEGNDGDQKAKQSADDRRKEQSRYDKKIGALTYQARQAQREAAELRAKLAEIDKRTAPKAPEKPKRAEYENEDDFFEALSDWKVERKLEERDAKQPKDDGKERQSQGPKVTREDWEAKETAFSVKNPDYEDVIADLEIPRTVAGAALSNAILTHEKGPELLYKLAKDPDLLDSVIALPPERVLSKLNRIAATLTAGAAAPQNNLPEPPRPVSGAGGGPKPLHKQSGKEILKHLEKINR